MQKTTPDEFRRQPVIAERDGRSLSKKLRDHDLVALRALKSLLE
jgi:hypothetical protein